MDCGNELDTNRASHSSPPSYSPPGWTAWHSLTQLRCSAQSSSTSPPLFKSRACLQLGGICQAKTSQSAAYRTGYEEGEQEATCICSQLSRRMSYWLESLSISNMDTDGSLPPQTDFIRNFAEEETTTCCWSYDGAWHEGGEVGYTASWQLLSHVPKTPQLNRLT